MRITIFNMLLLISCLIMLTVTLNLSANAMVTSIKAAAMTPATSLPDESIPMTSIIEQDEEIHQLYLTNTNIAKNNFHLTSLSYMIIITMFGGIASYLFTKYSLRPIKELSENMNKVNINNLNQVLVVPKSNDEIKDITTSFNNVLERLNASFESQKYFSESAAHELKTPLAVVQTKIDVFKKKSRNLDEYDSLIENIEKNTARLSDLVNDLLKITSANEVEMRDEVNLMVLVKDIVKQFKVDLDNKNINVILNEFDSSIKIKSNYNMLYQAFSNLIDNAIKYNITNGYIKIRCLQRSNLVSIEITNSGEVINSNDQTRIFEQFFRSDPSRNRNIAGSGLGLSTVKSIFDSLNYEINVQCKDEVSNTFIITLPQNKSIT